MAANLDYESLLKLPSGINDVESLFATERGSTYAHHSDATTTRNRSGANHKDKTTGIQPRSGKTIFMNPSDVNKVAGFFQNPDMATQFTPVFDKEGKPTKQVQLVLTEDYGPRKAGTVLAQAPYTTKPEVGLNPVEIYRSNSPMGDEGRGIHWGNKITEIHPKPERLIPSSGRGGGGMGGSMTSKLNPLSLQNLYAKGGSVKMPQEYSHGNWKLI